MIPESLQVQLPAIKLSQVTNKHWLKKVQHCYDYVWSINLPAWQSWSQRAPSPPNEYGSIRHVKETASKSWELLEVHQQSKLSLLILWTYLLFSYFSNDKQQQYLSDYIWTWPYAGPNQANYGNHPCAKNISFPHHYFETDFWQPATNAQAGYLKWKCFNWTAQWQCQTEHARPQLNVSWW